MPNLCYLGDRVAAAVSEEGAIPWPVGGMLSGRLSSGAAETWLSNLDPRATLNWP